VVLQALADQAEIDFLEVEHFISFISPDSSDVSDGALAAAERRRRRESNPRRVPADPGGDEASIDIEHLEAIAGQIPPRALLLARS
jgi:hypothetical protein